MDIINSIQIELPVRGELGRVEKMDLCRAVQASSRQQLVAELKKLMLTDRHFERLYQHQFRAWTVSVEAATYFLQHIFGEDCTITLIK